MAILHIIAKNLDSNALATLIARTNPNDGYVFIDDGVYVQLSKELLAFGTRPVFFFAAHVEERGLSKVHSSAVTLINMTDLVNLTTRYTSSMSW